MYTYTHTHLKDVEFHIHYGKLVMLFIKIHTKCKNLYKLGMRSWLFEY